MVDVTIQGDRALFTVERTHKMWSFPAAKRTDKKEPRRS